MTLKLLLNEKILEWFVNLTTTVIKTLPKDLRTLEINSKNRKPNNSTPWNHKSLCCRVHMLADHVPVAFLQMLGGFSVHCHYHCHYLRWRTPPFMRQCWGLQLAQCTKRTLSKNIDKVVKISLCCIISGGVTSLAKKQHHIIHIKNMLCSCVELQYTHTAANLGVIAVILIAIYILCS